MTVYYNEEYEIGDEKPFVDPNCKINRQNIRATVNDFKEEAVVQKTLAMRLLEGKGVPYEAVTYDSNVRDAEVVAEQVGAPEEQVFKTLVAVRDRGKPMVVMVPAPQQLDLKKLAKAMGEKKVKMASHDEAEKLTGLQVGGISPLLLVNRGFEILIDESAKAYDAVYVSAGEKGINLKVPVSALVELTGATYVAVTGS